MLLKNIPGVLPELSNSPITKSSIWHKDVKDISLFQLSALRKKYQILNYQDIDLDINYLVRHIQYAEMNKLCMSPLSRYTQQPSNRYMLSSELINGLLKMKTEYRQAVIFGLEMQLSAIRVSQLTVGQAHLLSEKTNLARHILKVSIPSIQTIHQFWTKQNGEHVALDDIHEVVYASFGMTWMELSARYRNLVATY